MVEKKIIISQKFSASLRAYFQEILSQKNDLYSSKQIPFKKIAFLKMKPRKSMQKINQALLELRPTWNHDIKTTCYLNALKQAMTFNKYDG